MAALMIRFLTSLRACTGRPTIGGPIPISYKLLNAAAINSRLAAAIGACFLGAGNSLSLTLASHICLELSEHGQHAEECAARRSRRIGAPLDDPEMNACLLDFMRDVCQIAKRSPQPVRPCDDQCVSLEDG